MQLNSLKSLLSLIAIFIYCLPLKAQTEQQYKLLAVGFYNLENLFDTVNDTLINDEEFLPDGANSWTEEKYREKVTNMASVIAKIGTDQAQGGLSVLGVSEIENRKVLEDLVKEPSLAARNYQIVHYNSPDFRGVDVAMLYNPNHFKVLDSKPIPLLVYSEEGKREYTRDILFVEGLLDGEKFYFLVNHWPSRRGGEEVTAKKRNKGAATCKQVIDSLYNLDPNNKVIVMGDLNDDPTNESLTVHLKAKGKKADVKPGDTFNPMYDLYRRGIGSNAYKDSWSLFDQIIVNEALVRKDQTGYYFLKGNVFNKQFLVQTSGQYKGYPFRTFSGNNYQGGYSDHFPSYIYLVKKI